MSNESEMELFSRILLHFTFDGISPALREPEGIAAEAREGITLLRALADR